MKKYLLLLLSFVFVTSAWAGKPPKPEKCPSVDSIRQTSFIGAQKLTDGTYAAVQLGTYDTKDNWAFVVVEIPAVSPHDAISQAKGALSSLSFLNGPGFFAQNNIWVCVYKVDADLPVVALTPIPTGGSINTASLLQ